MRVFSCALINLSNSINYHSSYKNLTVVAVLRHEANQFCEAWAVSIVTHLQSDRKKHYLKVRGSLDYWMHLDHIGMENLTKTPCICYFTQLLNPRIIFIRVRQDRYHNGLL